MVSFSDLNITQLKKVIRFYRLHILKDITGYTKNNRNELIELCEKMFHINENGISLKVSNPIVFDIPKGRVIKPKKAIKPKTVIKPKKVKVEKVKLKNDIEEWKSNNNIRPVVHPFSKRVKRPFGK